MNPKILYRQSDNMVFSLNDDGETYSLQMKDDFPDSYAGKYTLSQLPEPFFRETPADITEDIHENDSSSHG